MPPLTSIPISHPRRRMLRHLLAGLAAVSAWPQRLWAGARPRQAFASTSVDLALVALFGTANIPTSDKIRIGVARLAENGAVVPVKVEADLPGISEIALLATKNPVPLIARFDLTPRVRGFIATRVKLAESSEIVAVVNCQNGLFAARQAVEVTIGGCG